MRDSNDPIDSMIARLNLSGIPFVRDAWIDENGETGRKDYGVVELSGAPMHIYGDDRLIYQKITGNVVAYIMDGNDAKAAAVQKILAELSDEHFTFALVAARQFVKDIMANRWIWRFTAESYLNG